MMRIGHTRLKILMVIIAGRQRGMPPSLRDMARAAHVSLRAAQLHLRALKNSGLVDGGERKQARTVTPRVAYIPAGHFK